MEKERRKDEMKKDDLKVKFWDEEGEIKKEDKIGKKVLIYERYVRMWWRVRMKKEKGSNRRNGRIR